MTPKIGLTESIKFAARLEQALVEAGEPVRPSLFARRFNLHADGATVTSHGARKWLRGEAIPTQEKIVILAKWLDVNSAWLRYGDAGKGTFAGDSAEEGPSGEHLSLIHDVLSLDPATRLIVRALVDTLLRASRPRRLAPARVKASGGR